MMKTLSISALCAVLIAIAMPAAAEDKPEFDGNCAMSVAHGNSLPTDCSVVWISPKSGRLYCFSSEDAKLAFVSNASGNEDRAQASWKDPSFWEKLQRERGDASPEG
jgi:hypothetical protein